MFFMGTNRVWVYCFHNRHNFVSELESEMATRSTKSTATTKKTSTPKAKTGAAETTAKSAAKVSTPATTIVQTAKPVVAAGLVKKPELIDRIVAQTGLKKKDVKPVVEATLAVLAKTLINGEELQVPPLGKVKINQVKDIANAKILKVKIRHPIKDVGAGPSTPVEAAD